MRKSVLVALLGERAWRLEKTYALSVSYFFPRVESSHGMTKWTTTAVAGWCLRSSPRSIAAVNARVCAHKKSCSC